MNAEMLMNAIGGISDRHIEAFSVIEAKKYKSVRKTTVAIAACFCILLSAVVISGALLNNNHQSDVSPGELGSIIWGEPQQNGSIDEYKKSANYGEITITNSLQNAMDSNDDATALYAVFITEATDKSNDYIYNHFVKLLFCKEEYLDYGIVYATKAQISSWVCPQDMAIVLSLALRRTTK